MKRKQVQIIRKKIRKGAGEKLKKKRLIKIEKSKEARKQGNKDEERRKYKRKRWSNKKKITRKQRLRRRESKVYGRCRQESKDRESNSRGNTVRAHGPKIKVRDAGSME